jgi:hypothetical protein
MTSTPRRRAPTRKAAPRKATAPRKAAAPVRKAAAKKTAATPRKVATKASTRKTPLRVVKPDEKPPATPEPPRSLVDAADAGDERAMLVLLRRNIAGELEKSTTPARDKASLSIRLMQLTKDIQAYDARAKEDAADAGEVEDEAFDPEAL